MFRLSILSHHMLTNSTCGDSRASSDAPNGAEDWLNCGLTSGGWSPPHLGLDQLVTQSLHADGVFAPCAPYFWAFEQYGNANGSKSLLLLSVCCTDHQSPLSFSPLSLCRNQPVTQVLPVVTVKLVSCSLLR